MGSISGSGATERASAMASSTTLRIDIGIQSVGGGTRGPLIHRDAHRKPLRLLGHVLMNGVVGESRQRVAMRGEQIASTSAMPDACAARCTASKSSRHCSSSKRRGAITYPPYAPPTSMLWKRAGLAPWPVPITCSGWPLPQFGTPHSVQ